MVMTRPQLRRRARRALSAYVKLRRGRGKPMGEMFDASRVELMLLSGESEAAHFYLQRFLSVNDQSPASSDLLHQVGTFKIFATVARGGEEAAVLASMFQELKEEDFRQSPACLRQIKMIARMHANPRWAFKVWQQVEPVQVKKIMESISKCPDLQGEVRLRRKRTLLLEPIDRGLCKCTSRRRKTTKRVPSDAIVREFLHKRLLTISCVRNDRGFSSNGTSYSGISNMQIGPSVSEGDTTVGSGMLGENVSLIHQNLMQASSRSAR